MAQCDSDLPPDMTTSFSSAKTAETDISDANRVDHDFPTDMTSSFASTKTGGTDCSDTRQLRPGRSSGRSRRWKNFTKESIGQSIDVDVVRDRWRRAGKTTRNLLSVANNRLSSARQNMTQGLQGRNKRTLASESCQTGEGVPMGDLQFMDDLPPESTENRGRSNQAFQDLPSDKTPQSLVSIDDPPVDIERQPSIWDRRKARLSSSISRLGINGVRVKKAAKHSYTNIKNCIPAILLAVYSVVSAGLLHVIEQNVEWTLYPRQLNDTCLGTDFWRALFYVNTLYTTIGYGNIHACTSWSRFLSVIIAIIGIPLVFVVLDSGGRFLGMAMNKFCVVTSTLAQWVRQKRHGKASSGSLWDGMKVSLREDQPIHVPIYLGIIMTVGWILLCAAYFSLTEDLSYMPSLYFSLISLMTIGLGDIAPHHHELTILTFFAILVGLSLVSMEIKIIQAHIEQLFNQMKIDIQSDMLKSKSEDANADDLSDVLRTSALPRHQRYLQNLMSERQIETLDRMYQKRLRLRMRGVQVSVATETRGTNPIAVATENRGTNPDLQAFPSGNKSVMAVPIMCERKCQTDPIKVIPELAVAPTGDRRRSPHPVEDVAIESDENGRIDRRTAIIPPIEEPLVEIIEEEPEKVEKPGTMLSKVKKTLKDGQELIRHDSKRLTDRSKQAPKVEDEGSGDQDGKHETVLSKFRKSIKGRSPNPDEGSGEQQPAKQKSSDQQNHGKSETILGKVKETLKEGQEALKQPPSNEGETTEAEKEKEGVISKVKKTLKDGHDALKQSTTRKPPEIVGQESPTGGNSGSADQGSTETPETTGKDKPQGILSKVKKTLKEGHDSLKHSDESTEKADTDHGSGSTEVLETSEKPEGVFSKVKRSLKEGHDSLKHSAETTNKADGDSSGTQSARGSTELLETSEKPEGVFSKVKRSLKEGHDSLKHSAETTNKADGDSSGTQSARGSTELLETSEKPEGVFSKVKRSLKEGHDSLKHSAETTNKADGDSSGTQSARGSTELLETSEKPEGVFSKVKRSLKEGHDSRKYSDESDQSSGQGSGKVDLEAKLLKPETMLSKVKRKMTEGSALSGSKTVHETAKSDTVAPDAGDAVDDENIGKSDTSEDSENSAKFPIHTIRENHAELTAASTSHSMDKEPDQNPDVSTREHPENVPSEAKEILASDDSKLNDETATDSANGAPAVVTDSDTERTDRETDN